MYCKLFRISSLIQIVSIRMTPRSVLVARYMARRQLIKAFGGGCNGARHFSLTSASAGGHAVPGGGEYSDLPIKCHIGSREVGSILVKDPPTKLG